MGVVAVVAPASPFESGMTTCAQPDHLSFLTDCGLRNEESSMDLLEPGFFQAKLREYEARLIREALQRAHGNQARAARMLGVPPTTLASQLRRLGIQARDFKRRINSEWPLVPS